MAKNNELPYQYYKLSKHNELKETDIKYRTYYCFNAIININDFILKNIKVYQKSYRDIFIQ